jgi:hypothetical protein
LDRNQPAQIRNRGVVFHGGGGGGSGLGGRQWGGAVIQGVGGGLLTGIERPATVWLRWRAVAPVSGQRNAKCGGRSGRRGAPGLGDVRGWVVRAGGRPGENDTSGCLR